MELLVGWQVNKNNSPVCSTSILDKKDVINGTTLSNNQLRISGTKRFILQKHIILRLLTDLEPIVLDSLEWGTSLSTIVTVLRPAVDL